MGDPPGDPERGVPVLFRWSARLLPAALSAQFLLAGQALFGGMSWGAHGAVGGLIALPVLLLALGAAVVPRLRGLGWWAGAAVILYLLQVGLAAAGPSGLAFHPFNAALLLAASLVLLGKVERRVSAGSG